MGRMPPSTVVQSVDVRTNESTPRTVTVIFDYKYLEGLTASEIEETKAAAFLAGLEQVRKITRAKE